MKKRRHFVKIYAFKTACFWINNSCLPQTNYMVKSIYHGQINGRNIWPICEILPVYTKRTFLPNLILTSSPHFLPDVTSLFGGWSKHKKVPGAQSFLPCPRPCNLVPRVLSLPRESRERTLGTRLPPLNELKPLWSKAKVASYIERNLFLSVTVAQGLQGKKCLMYRCSINVNYVQPAFSSN